MPESEQTQNEESLPGGGFLTKKDRKYLWGELEVEGSTERRRRYEIRNRTKKALVDFRYLRHLSERDRLRVFGDTAGWWINQEESALSETEPTDEGALKAEGLISLIELMAYSLPTQTVRDVIETGLEQVVLEHMAIREEKYVPVDISIEIERSENESMSLGELKEKVEEGEQVPAQSLYALEVAGELSFDELYQYSIERGKELLEE